MAVSLKKSIKLIFYFIVVMLLITSQTYGETWNEIYSQYEGMLNSWDTALLLIFVMGLLIIGIILFIRSMILISVKKYKPEENTIYILKERLINEKIENNKFSEKNTLSQKPKTGHGG